MTAPATELRPSDAFVSIKPLALIVLASTYAAILVVVLMASLNSGSPGRLWVAAALTGYFACLTLPYLLVRSHLGWFHPLIFFATYVVWAFELSRTLPVFLFGLNFHHALPERGPVELNSLVVEGLLLSSLSLLSTYAGFLAMVGVRAPTFVTPEPRRALLKIVIVGGVSAIAVIVLSRYAGGLGMLLLQRGLAAEDRVTSDIGGAHWHALAGLLTTCCVVWAAAAPQVIKYPAFLLIFSLGVFLDFAATGSRAGVLQPAFMLFAVVALHRGKMPALPLAIFVLMAVAIVGALGAFRDASRSADVIDKVQMEFGLGHALGAGLATLVTRGGEQNGLYGVLGKVPDEVKPLWGKSYLSVPASPVPRALWPDKPYAGGKLTAQYVFGRYDAAIPPGSVGEAVLNFRWPGVIAIFFVWGLVLRVITEVYRQNSSDIGVRAVFVLTLFTLQPNSEAVYDWLQTVVPALLFLRILCPGQRSRPY